MKRGNTMQKKNMEEKYIKHQKGSYGNTISR